VWTVPRATTPNTAENIDEKLGGNNPPRDNLVAEAEAAAAAAAAAAVAAEQAAARMSGGVEGDKGDEVGRRRLTPSNPG